MYNWLKISSPDDYDNLTSLVGREYAPEVVVPRLKQDISPAVKGILVEHNYIDKDYRSTFYNFYSKKGRSYKQDCVRLHFFSGEVSFDIDHVDIKANGNRLEDNYFGFMVLRPTLVWTVGRSVLSPDIRMGAAGSIIQSKHRVHLLGYKLQLWGFPSMDQHTDISVCAHVACWAILRHYSERYPQHRELLMHDVTLMAHQFNPGGLVPANGLDINEAERVFHQANTYPLIVAKTKANTSSFYRQLLAYLESGFPLFVAMYGNENNAGHAIALIGHSWRADAIVPPGGNASAWDQVACLIAVDDNQLPYLAVPLTSAPNASYSAAEFDSYIVPLPDKIFYPAEAVERQAATLARIISRFVPMPKPDDLIVRYFVTTLASLRTFSRENESGLGAVLTGAVMQLDTAQFVWVVEYSSRDDWTAGHIAARAVLDATASPHDPVPVWFAHGRETAIFFDRESVPSSAVTVDLKRPSNQPLNRMEQNLRPIVTRK